MWFRGRRFEQRMTEAVERILEDALNTVRKDIEGIATVTELRRTITTLQEEKEKALIEKDRREEEWGRKEREIKHKVGLEQKRQEQEIELAKREAKLEVGESNLEQERKLSEQQMKFEREQLQGQYDKLFALFEPVLKALPSAEIITTISKGEE